MSIQNELNKIKNAVYGREVRGAIHDAIKQTYDDASIEKDNANMEVKMARGKHPTLNDRLNGMRDVTSQTIRNNEKTNERIDDIITTPAGEVNQQEIIDARDGEDSLGSNIRKIKKNHLDEGLVTLEMSDGTQNIFETNESGQIKMDVNLGYTRFKNLEFYRVQDLTNVRSLYYRRPNDMKKGESENLADIQGVSEVSGAGGTTATIGKFTTNFTTDMIAFSVAKTTTRESFEKEMDENTLIVYKLENPYTEFIEQDNGASVKEIAENSININKLQNETLSNNEMSLKSRFGDKNKFFVDDNLMYTAEINVGLSRLGDLEFRGEYIEDNCKILRYYRPDGAVRGAQKNIIDFIGKKQVIGNINLDENKGKYTTTTTLAFIDFVVSLDSNREEFEVANGLETGIIYKLEEPYISKLDDTNNNTKELLNFMAEESGRLEEQYKKDVYEELRGNIYQRDYRVDKLFNVADTEVSEGSTLSSASEDKYLKNNTEALKVTIDTTKGDSVIVDVPLSEPINLYKRTFGVNFYLPYETTRGPRKAKFDRFSVYLETPDGWFINYPDFGAPGSRRYEGWNMFVGEDHLFDDSGVTPDSLREVTAIRILIDTNTKYSEPYDIYLDSFVSWEMLSEPTILLEFDDGYRSVYENAFPLMAERGMRGAVHVITKHITEPNPEKFITNDQLIRMHDVGWDVCSHSVNHEYISELTEEEQLYELEQSQKDLLSLGLKNGPQFYVAPYGDNTPYAVEQSRKIYQNYRMTGYRIGQPAMPPLPYAMECLGASGRGFENVLDDIDKLSRYGGHLALMWHGEIGEVWNGVKWETSEFEYLLDYILERDIKVITYSDMFPGTQIK